MSAPIALPKIFNDTFTDTNGTAVTSHTPDLTTSGITWSQTTGTAFYIQGNTLQPNRLTDGDIASIDTKLNDYTVQMVVTPYFATSTDKAMPDIIVRYINSSNFWYFYPDTQTNNIYLYQVSGGIHTKFMTYPFVQASGVPIAIRVDCVGANMTLWINGVEIITYTWTAVLTGTGVGVRSGVGSAGASTTGRSSWDNFSVQPYLGSTYNWPQFVKPTVVAPVVARGAGSEWDATDANNPNVAYDSTNNRLVLDYSGYYNGGSAPGTRVQHAGQAYLSGNDPSVGTWTKDGANPVIVSNGGDGFYAWNGGLCKKGNTWYRLYCTTNASQIALATSTDLTNWTRQGVVFQASAVPGAWDGNAVFDPFIRLRQDGKTFEMWYGAKNAGAARDLGYATSTDAINWTRNPTNPVIALPYWNSDNTIRGEPSVFVPQGKEGTEMLVSYDTCRVGLAGNRFIAQAATIDGGITWSHRMVASPPGTGWESAQNFDSFVYQYGNNLYMFYSGADLAGAALNLDIQIGMSTASWPYESLAANTRKSATSRTAVT